MASLEICSGISILFNEFKDSDGDNWNQTKVFKYFLQHERPCCIKYANTSRRRFVYLIHTDTIYWQSNFKNTSFVG